MPKLYLKYMFKVNEAGKFIFYSYDNFEKQIAKHPGVEGEMIFRERQQEVSDKQFWYYNQLLSIIEDDTGMSMGEIDRYFQDKHIAKIRRLHKGVTREFPRPLEDLNMNQFSKYIDQVKQEMIQEFDIPEERLDPRKIATGV